VRRDLGTTGTRQDAAGEGARLSGPRVQRDTSTEEETSRVINPAKRIWAAAIAVAVLATACTSAATPSPTAAPTSGATAGATTAPATNPPAGSIQINGAGATFPFPLYSRWFYEYAFKDPTVKFNYQSIGSGGGIQQITQKTVDFGASDAILTDAQYTAAPGIQMFPTVAGSEAVVYNVSELKDASSIVLDGTTVANIFLGKIKKWNDAAIAALNPGVSLPNKDLVIVHRSDGSGTTYIFTDYLSNVSAEWKSGVGTSTSVKWPVGLGGKGNEGVAGTLAQTEGSIAYVELAYAVTNKLKSAKLKNATGTIVEPGIKSTQAAMSDFGTNLGDKLAISIVNGSGKDTYPIAGYTYLLAYMDQTDCTKAGKIVSFIKWALKDGSKFAEELNYVPLPDAVESQVEAKLAKMTCKGQPVTAS
jgi:phosphate transport system substrate-binding protein